MKCHLISGRGQHAQHCRTTLAAPTRIIWGPRCAEEKDDPCVVSRETEVVLAISPIPRSRQACLLPHIKPETGHRPLPTTNRTADTGHVTARKTTQSGAARPTHRPFRATSRLISHLSPHASPFAIRHSPLATRHSPARPRQGSHAEPARRERDPPRWSIDVKRRGVSRETWAYGLRLAPWPVLTSLPHRSSWKPRSPARSTQSQSMGGDPSRVGTPHRRPERGAVVDTRSPPNPLRLGFEQTL